ncbi:MAG: ATP synthase F1 subunit delta [Planctomycetota bacterium]
MASDFETFNAAAAIYADSILELATTAGQADAIAEELASLSDLWRREPSFAAMMSSAAIDEDARRDSLKRIFAGKVSGITLNLLLVLNHRRRAMILPHVCEAFHRKRNAAMCRAAVQVISAAPLDDGQRNKIAAEVKRLTGKAADFIERVDPSVLAGLSIQVGDRVYDFSARRRIRDIRRSLAESLQRYLIGGAGRFVTEG